MRTFRRVSGLVLTTACAAIMVGCGGDTGGGPRLYTVAGTVSFTGEPVKEADLLVRSVDGKYASGTKVTDGKFLLKAPVGPKVVEITALRDVPGQFREENPGEKVAVKEQFLPPKYNSETMLTLEIKPDTKDVKFDLTP